MSFHYLPLFCGLSNTLISAPAEVKEGHSKLEQISGILTIHKIVEDKGITLPAGADISGLSKSLISAPAWNVLPLSSTILWIVKYPDICYSW
jgi:hypothetical protein